MKKRIFSVKKIALGLCVALLASSQMGATNAKAQEVEKDFVRHEHYFCYHYNSGAGYTMSSPMHRYYVNGEEYHCYPIAVHSYYYGQCSCMAINSTMTCDHLNYLDHTTSNCDYTFVYFPLPDDLPH